MATSSKFDLPSGSPDRPLYTSGQRGSHITGPLDRSGSFRESMENPILSSLPNMLRSSSAVTQGDVVNFLQCLRFDPKVLAAEHKASRQVEFKRHVGVALGISPDDSPSGSSKGKLLPLPLPEEIKRVKACLREISVKASRERVKIFNESLSVFNKFFPSIPSKKRSRSESFSSDRSSVLPSDRSVLGPNVGKIGIQSHAITSGFELEQQKPEERTKNAVPNKRTRTSLVDVRMDVRSNALVRPSGVVDRDREMLRIANGGAVQAEDRTLPIGGDGWEKSKMKKKRSGIKPDVSPSTLSNKQIDGYREPKQGIQQRPVTDARSRLSNESHGFRPGVLNGAVGVGKSDGISQQTGLGMRSSIPRTDPENNSLTNDRRDRPIGSDKERVNVRTVNKTNVRDDFNSASPTSNAKMNSSVRAPRSGSGVAPKLSPVVHRTNVQNDWELSNCTNKPPAAVSVNNRKRMASTRSSSPPVAHWASQRPQKISRTARRTNLVPIVSSNDETPNLDTGSDVTGNDIGLGFAKRLPGSSPQQVKLKSDPLSSATLSESEESGAVETKSRDKSRKSDEIDEKAGQNVQKVSSLVLPSRKNKPVAGEELGDGVRRQGRTGRGFTSTRSLMPMTVEKLGNVGTAKQLRSARLGFDKTESKAGRPPTRKLSDRKAYPRQKHTAINAAADFLVGSDDGHEELLAAANAVINHARAFGSSFWKQMEPFFGFISDADIAFLKQQGNLDSTAPTPTPVHSNVVGCNAVPNGFGLIKHEKEMGLATETSSIELLAEQLVPGTGDHSLIPLCQRLIAALISEEDCSNGNEDLKYNDYGTDFELDGELEPNNLNHQSLVSFQFAGPTAFNGYRITGKAEHDEPDSNIVGILGTGMNSSFGLSPNGLHSDQPLMPNMACSEFQYDNMQINEKLLLEVRSVGIFPEPVPDMATMEDEGISDEIGRLEEKYQGLVSEKKGLLDRLLKSASAMKDLQEKEFEQRALDKLVGMACEKYMSCWGTHGTGGKSSSNKIAKQAALAFVKRTLERCHKFEDTGKSCFSEPLFKDMFLSGSFNLDGARQTDTTTEGESTKPYASIRSLEASMGSQQSPSQFSQNLDSHDINSLDALTPVNHVSEQTTGREDIWSNRVKKRELLLDDVGGPIGTSSAQPGIGTLSSSAKGKRSERDRDGKGHSREILSRNGTTRIGRPALSNVKGERKSKTKPKQRTTQLSVSVNGLVGKISDQPKPALSSVSKSNEIATRSNVKGKDEFGLDVLDEHESLDLSHLQLPGMDVLGVSDDLDDQGQDLGSWLNIDDDALQDNDFMGLQIPMDDLSDLNMMV
ncbi:uncharacterized protein LOC133856895 isoform X1 [Alnus glutinosa]|uniref:uncharacterized protein LOC133856895 isoform X1 n=1 Tax=Alnus glutinosa TaxID=3517 RepID=UPI002D770B5A|nr:uncharacterized protein LOC133856895 isoform X1 [Alnus glutinosa]